MVVVCVFVVVESDVEQVVVVVAGGELTKKETSGRSGWRRQESRVDSSDDRVLVIFPHVFNNGYTFDIHALATNPDSLDPIQLPLCLPCSTLLA